MHKLIFMLLLGAAPTSIYLALAACSALWLQTSKDKVFLAVAEARNLPIYICIAALSFGYAIWENTQLIRLAGLMFITLFLCAAVEHLRFAGRLKLAIDSVFWRNGT